MKDENHKQNGEWFFDIKKIVATIKNIKEGYKDEGLNATDEWYFYINPEYENIAASKLIKWSC
jgi:hypothetical protein